MSTSLKWTKKDEDHAIAEGYGVVFGGSDLEGETFTPETDYMLDLVPTKLAFIDHSLGSELELDGKAYQLKGIDDPVGEVVQVTPDDTGLYMRLMFDKASRYWSLVESMIDSGKAGLSTGAISHLARRDGGIIKRWPIVETSITLTPAEPRTIGVGRLKSLVEANPSLKALLTETPASVVEDATDEDEPKPQTINITIIEEQKMSDETKVVDEQPVKEQPSPDYVSREQFESVTKQLSDLMEMVRNNGPLKDAGYIAPDSEADHKETKSFGDYLTAVMYGNRKRLGTVYGIKDLEEQGGASGGYLVPEEYQARLLEVATEQAVVRPRAASMQVGSNTGKIPALNQLTVTNQGTGETAFAGGVVMGWAAEGATLSETQPAFREIQWNIHKLGGYTEVSNELIADARFGIDALLTRLFGTAIAAMEDYSFLRGDGVGKPLGILNAPAAVAVNPANNNQFAILDAMNMLSRFKPVGGSPVWLMHRGLIPDFQLYFQAGTAGMDFIQPREGVPQSLLGYPIVFCEHLPQDDNSGAAILADLQGYMIFDRAGLQIAYSEHAAFTNDKGTWRVIKRLDGQPWVEDDMELADPQGSYTVSPFVYHND